MVHRTEMWTCSPKVGLVPRKSTELGSNKAFLGSVIVPECSFLSLPLKIILPKHLCETVFQYNKWTPVLRMFSALLILSLQCHQSRWQIMMSLLQCPPSYLFLNNGWCPKIFFLMKCHTCVFCQWPQLVWETSTSTLTLT